MINKENSALVRSGNLMQYTRL